MLVHRAAGVGNRQCDTARIAGAGIDYHQRIAEAAAMGTVCFRHGMMSPLRSGSAPNGGSPTPRCPSGLFNSVGISTDTSDPERVAFQDHLDTILYSDYILFFKYFIGKNIMHHNEYF